LNRLTDVRRNQEYFATKNAEWFKQEINALQVYVVVENWRLKKAAKGVNAENQDRFEKLLAFLN
jgi:hypothetical protein